MYSRNGKCVFGDQPAAEARSTNLPSRIFLVEKIKDLIREISRLKRHNERLAARLDYYISREDEAA